MSKKYSEEHLWRRILWFQKICPYLCSNSFKFHWKRKSCFWIRS